MTRLILCAILATVAALPVIVVAADAKLAIVAASVQMIEDGPPLGPSESYVGGETAYFSCQISGFQASPAPKEKISLVWDIAVKDSAGLALVPPYSGKIEA